MKRDTKIKTWFHGLLTLTAFIWFAAAICARADDSSNYTYVFAEVKIYTGQYGATPGPTYFSEVVKLSTDRFNNNQDDLKKIVKKQVEKLLQSDETINNIDLVNENTFDDATKKRSQDMDADKNYPYSPGNEVRECTVDFNANVDGDDTSWSGKFGRYLGPSGEVGIGTKVVLDGQSLIIYGYKLNNDGSSVPDAGSSETVMLGSIYFVEASLNNHAVTLFVKDAQNNPHQLAVYFPTLDDTTHFYQYIQHHIEGSQ